MPLDDLSQNIFCAFRKALVFCSYRLQAPLKETRRFIYNATDVDSEKKMKKLQEASLEHTC